jgi:hypothetical protein
MQILTLAFALLLAAPAAEIPQGGPTSDEEARAALNREQAEVAQKQLQQNAAGVEAMKVYEEQLKAYEADKARVAREHDEAMARWQADVTACKGGDRSRCAPE